MTIIVSLAVGLIVAGLVIAWLSGSAGPTLGGIVRVVGIVLVVVGMVLLVAPVVAWVDVQLRMMLNAR